MSCFCSTKRSCKKLGSPSPNPPPPYPRPLPPSLISHFPFALPLCTGGGEGEREGGGREGERGGGRERGREGERESEPQTACLGSFCEGLSWEKIGTWYDADSCAREALMASFSYSVLLRQIGFQQQFSSMKTAIDVPYKL